MSLQTVHYNAFLIARWSYSELIAVGRVSLSVGIVTYNVDPALFEKVLVSLDAAIAHARDVQVLGSVQVTIVDNGRDAKLLGDLVSERSDYFLVSNQTNTGFARAHNQAFDSMDADFHLVLNPDALLSRDALQIGLTHLQKEADTVMVSPHAELPDGSSAFLCKRYPSVLDLAIRGFLPANLLHLAADRLAAYECHDFGNRGVTRGVSIVSGCCMLVRASKLRQVGGFNEKYFLYFEDFDLSLKLARLGSIDFVPDMRIVHHGGGASRKGIRHIAMFCRSAITFFMENGWKLA